MRKNLTLTFLIFSVLITFGQETQIEKKINEIKFQQFKNRNLIEYDFKKQTKGKITIIEFWETWCGPCIKGMHHLKKLKEAFPNTLEIVCVSKDDKMKTLDFISKKDFNFIFIYDSLKQLNKVFPHTSIPHTVLVDIEGNINAQTYPDYITEQTIKDLLQKQRISLPQKYIPNTNKKNSIRTNKSLCEFNIERHQLGEPNIARNHIKTIPVQIVTGYSGTEYIDTFETIRSNKLSGKNILALYQYALNDYPISRFIFSKEIDYIESKKPNHLYNLNFSASSFFGDSKKLLKRQLDGAFNLRSETISKDTAILRILNIDTSSASISKPVNLKGSSKTIENRGNVKFTIDGQNISTLEIARAIESKVKIPVIFEPQLNDKFDTDITILDYNQDINVWIEHFKNNGITLNLDSGKVDYVKIRKGSP